MIAYLHGHCAIDVEISFFVCFHVIDYHRRGYVYLT